jgi:hypothetical protein
MKYNRKERSVQIKVTSYISACLDEFDDDVPEILLKMVTTAA